MSQGGFHCCRDAESISLIYGSPEENFQIVDLFVHYGLFETVEPDPISYHGLAVSKSFLRRTIIIMWNSQREALRSNIMDLAFHKAVKWLEILTCWMSRNTIIVLICNLQLFQILFTRFSVYTIENLNSGRNRYWHLPRGRHNDYSTITQSFGIRYWCLLHTRYNAKFPEQKQRALFAKMAYRVCGWGWRA